MTPEGKVKAKVKAWLKARKIWHFSPVSNGMGVHGIPDVIAVVNSRFVGIETKAPGKLGNLSEPQKYQIAGIRESGGIVLVVDDVSQLEVLEELLT